MNLKFIKEEALIILKTPNYQKKICKFFFTKRDASLYVHFYFNGKKYYYGYKKIQAEEKSLTFRFTEGREVVKSPKLSYHESGDVHFKINNQLESIEKVKVTPLNQLNNNHIITIIAGGLDYFEDVTSNSRMEMIAISYKEQVKSIKITTYASINEDLLKEYPLGFVLQRPAGRILGSLYPSRKIFFGINFISQEPISKDKSGITVITGWDVTAQNISKPASFLYFQAF